MVKLLPTTQLHHKRIGAICIGILILQDLIAILILAFIVGIKHNYLSLPIQGIYILMKLCLLVILALLIEGYILRKMILRLERLHEMIFILGLAWCLGVGWLSSQFGLSYEIGAFIAGVLLARHPISLFISEKLKPLRDFFLVLFFFSLGASIDFIQIKSLIPKAALIALLYVILKSHYFRFALREVKEPDYLRKEIGIRMSQASEFSLLVALSLFEFGFIDRVAFNFIQLITIFTFVISSYIVVLKYPTPVGVKEELIQH